MAQTIIVINANKKRIFLVLNFFFPPESFVIEKWLADMFQWVEQKSAQKINNSFSNEQKIANESPGLGSYGFCQLANMLSFVFNADTKIIYIA